MIKELNYEKNGNIPCLAFHSMTLTQDYLIIYGGLKPNNELSGDLYFLNLEKQKFSKANWENNIKNFPCPRYCHSTAYDSEKKILYIFGGFIDENPKLSSELWTLNVNKKPTFSLIKNFNISNRSNSVMFIDKRVLYIYGGYGISKVSDKLKILNDLRCLKLDINDEVKEINTKGGLEMENCLFKATKLRDKMYAFISSDISKFYILNIKTFNFQKIIFKFIHPTERFNYSLDIISDGRIILFGGSNKDECFNEAFVLQSFEYFNETHYSWTALDISGPLHNCYNGHASVVLENNHILIHGGTTTPLNPISINNYEVSSRFQIIDIYNNYTWLDPIKSNSEQLHIYPRTQHLLLYLPKENHNLQSEEIIFIHGGDLEGKILCHYSMFDLNNKEWIYISNKNFCPQLKSHSGVRILDPTKNEPYVIIMGGLYVDHLSNCEAKTNREKERCACVTQSISEKVYAFRNHAFIQVSIKNKELFGDRLKRFGHNLLYINKEIYFICGFAQYIGYMIDIIKFKVCENIKDKSFYFEGENVDINVPKQMSGRMFSSVNVIYDYIVIFGGVADNITFNDMWMINYKTLQINQIEINNKYIYPRFGMSSIVKIREESARIIVYGGSYWAGPNMISGITNEILSFHLKFVKQEKSYIFLEADKFIPVVYGKASKRIFHQSFLYKDNMIVFGGPNNLILSLRLTNLDENSYNSSLLQYQHEYIMYSFEKLFIDQMDKFHNDEYSIIKDTESNKSILPKKKISNTDLNYINDESSILNMSNSINEEKGLLSSRIKKKEHENKEWDKNYK